MPPAAAITLLLIVVLPARLEAAENLPMGSAMLQMLWALLIVLGLILILYWLARRRFGMGGAGSGEIRVLEQRHLMPKASLALIEVRDRQLLVGITGERIALLADLSVPVKDKTTFDSMLAQEK